MIFCSQGLPCHLYFDLEFNKRVNPEKDGDEMVDLLISVILEGINEKYSITGDPEWIVELDSSTDGMDFSLLCPCRSFFLFFAPIHSRLLFLM